MHTLDDPNAFGGQTALLRSMLPGTTAAPVSVQNQPCGWNGFQFSAIVAGET